jgi:DNA-binding transcriptional regulator GbsR (MarR family)
MQGIAHTGFAAVQESYAELAGRATAVYGLSPLLGRLWGVLLLSPEPLGLDMLAAAVGAAKSTVSVSMRQLEHYRLVERHWRRGDRRDYYAARTDYLAILRDWYRLFGQHELAFMTQANATARRALERGAEGEDWPSPEERALLLERLVGMDDLISLVRGWIAPYVDAATTPEVAPAEVIPIEVEA